MNKGTSPMTTMRTDTSKNGLWRRRALPAAITLGLLAAFPALAASGAQDAAQSQQQRSDNSQQDRPEAQDQQDEAKQLGTITVTATGRVQEVIAVPYNISTVSGDSIQRYHVRSQAELLRSIPGVNFVDSGPRNTTVVNNIRIRGINVDSSAMGDYAVTGAASVAVYVDSVPLFANFQLMDIQRVEVLRGPQGTLYGSGALGGTVRYIMNKPQLNEFSGRVSGSLSSVKYSSGIGNSESFILNVPLGNTMALRVNAKRNDYPGVTDYVDLYRMDDQEPVGHPVAPDGILSDSAEYYTKEDADTVEQNYGRVALYWQPNDSFDMTLTYMVEADRFGGRRGQSLGKDGFGYEFQRNEIGSPQLEPAKRHVHLTALEASVDMGFATLTSSTSYYDQKGDITSDNTGFYAQLGWFASYSHYPRELHTAVRRYREAAFTQEFRLVSTTGGAFDYIAGLYYRNENSTTAQDSYVVGFKDWFSTAYPGIADWVLDDRDFHYVNNGHFRELAVYGQGTWYASDSLSFTLGARYFRDHYVSDMYQQVMLWDIPGGASRETTRAHDVHDNNKALFMANMSWWFSGSTQLYATVSEGYRRGGANAVNLGKPAVEGGSIFTDYPVWLYYKPDTLINYEVGIKGILGRNLTYTADVFWADWQNPQLNTATTYGGYFAVQNMGEARSRGLEFSAQGRVGDSFQYGGGYAYTDAELTEDAYTPDAGLPSRTVPGAVIDGFIAPAGTRLPGVSKHRLNAYANYTIAAQGGAVTFHVDGNYQSSAENSISQSEAFKYTLPGFTMWNASVGYYATQWSAILWLKNITNVKGATGIYKKQYMGTAPAEGFYADSSKLLTAVPRTIGVTFAYKF